MKSSKTAALGYAFDAFVIACMTLLLAMGRCELKDFFLVVSPILGIRAWQARNGGPPPGITGSAAIFFLLPFLSLLVERKSS